MKTTIFCCALALPLAASTGYAQSVEELLGLTVPGMQAPPSTPEDSSHASAEEAPLYLSFTVNPLVQGDIALQSTTAQGGAALSSSKIKFDVGVGVGVAVGYRIPDTYVVLELSSGFLWSEVNNFSGSLTLGGGTDQLNSTDGSLYQIPILASAGLEFDLPGGWPFLNGGLIRFGPSVGVTWYDLNVNNISRGGFPNERYTFGRSGWVFAYGAFVSIDFFLSHNVALSIGYQFMGTSPIDYGGLEEEPGSPGALPAGNSPSAKTNFTYVNIVKCGVSIYF